MTAADLKGYLSGVRPAGTCKWIARCPAHDDRSPSLSITQAGDRILVKCWAGCSAPDIMREMGLSLADLFTHKQYKPSAISLRRQRAEENLQSWRKSEVRRVAEELRGRDAIIRAINATVVEEKMTHEEAAISLEYEYRGYSALEYRFERLLRNQDTLQQWRESRLS
jgi:hypothetical protein